MGFVRKRHYKMVFEDSDLAGLEVTVNGPSIDQVIDAVGLVDRLSAGDVTAINPLLDMLGEALVSWNLEEPDGTPVTADRAGLGTLDLPLARQLVTSWIRASSGVTPPLESSSTSGAASEVASLPMEPLSPSPTS